MVLLNAPLVTVNAYTALCLLALWQFLTLRTHGSLTVILPCKLRLTVFVAHLQLLRQLALQL